MLAALSLPWLGLAGLGGPPAILLGGSSSREDSDNLRLLAAVWSFGLCLDYALLVLLGQLSLVFVVEGLLAIVFAAAALWRCRGRFVRPERCRPWLIALVVLLAGTIAILLDPLQNWDARSIWFFHAKMIYYGGGLTQTIGLDIPGVPHPAYPMLVPGLAAELAGLLGFWNEYLPKLSLALLLPVPILTVLMLRRTPISMTLLVLAYWFIVNRFFYNGSMDGYLALYAAAAVFFLADWLEGGGDAALLAAAGALGVAGGLKAEGQVVYLALGLTLAVLLARRKLVLPRPSLAALMLAPLPFMGYVLWHILVATWSLRLDKFTLGHAWSRLIDPAALWLIFRSLLLHPGFYVPALGVLAVILLARRRAMALPASAQLPLLAGLAYVAGFFTIFAMTSQDLQWHLNTAAERVIRSGTEMLVIGGTLILRDLERAKGLPLIGALASVIMPGGRHG